MASSSLSNEEYLLLAELKEHEAYATGCSVPSSKMCDNMAPMPKGEASQAANTIGFQSSKCTSKFGEDNNCLTSSKDCSN